MRIIRYIICILGLSVLTGCGTPGHFALVDLDGRSDTQRAADSPALQAQYTGQTTVREPVVKEKSMWINLISSLGSLINFRLQLFSVDWGVDPGRKDHL